MKFSSMQSSNILLKHIFNELVFTVRTNLIEATGKLNPRSIGTEMTRALLPETHLGPRISIDAFASDT